MKLVILAAVLGTALAACPNKCSSHGKCMYGDKCECESRWVGLDCSERECPYGVSWVTSKMTEGAPMGRISTTNAGLGGMHKYAECSDKGECDRSSGECTCYEGFAGRGCRRMACPNDCSGHGYCLSNADVNVNYDKVAGGALNTQYWDSTRAFQCKCDSGYKGLDCSERMCPKGDDPMVDCPGPSNAAQVDDIQMLIFDTSSTSNNFGEVGNIGYFALTFTDMFGANYTTKPIYLGPNDAANNALPANNHAPDIEAALEELPNFVVPNVTVSKIDYNCKTDGGAADCGDWTSYGESTLDIPTRTGMYHGHRYAVTFVDDINSGQQNKLQCSYAGGQTVDGQIVKAEGFAAAAPRLDVPLLNWKGGVYNKLERACQVMHVVPVDHDGSAGSPDKLQAVCERYAGAHPGFDNLPDADFFTFEWMSHTNQHTSVTLDDACTLEGLAGKEYEEHVECSNRGSCDTGTGLCECYDGFTGEACASQTVYF